MRFVKTFFCLLFVLVLSSNLFPHDFFAGLKIGPGITFAHGDDTDDLDPAAGMSLGLFGTYSPVRFFAVQAELNYELKSFSFKADILGGTLITRQDLHYFSIPLITKGNFSVSRLLIHPYFGLNFSFLMKAKGHAQYDGALGNYKEKDTNTDNFEVFDLGILFGAETFIKVTDHFFVAFDLRFNIGVLEIIEDADVFNGAFYVLFGAVYKF